MFSGTSPDGRLVEYVELPRDVHPYFVATQAHPELRSRPTRAHPLFARARAGGARPARRDSGLARRLTSPDLVLDADLVGGTRPTLADEPDPRSSSQSELLFEGAVWDVRRDTVELGDGQTVVRDYVAPPRRRRHPRARRRTTACCSSGSTATRSRMMLWEPPAGLLDVAGRAARGWPPPASWSRRRDSSRPRWDVLVDFYNTPGGSSETFRVLPRARPAPAPEAVGTDGDGEERDMPYTWVPLDEAVDGRPLRSAATRRCGRWGAGGVRPERRGWSTLRPVDTPWPARDWVVAGRARVYGSSSPHGAG